MAWFNKNSQSGRGIHVWTLRSRRLAQEFALSYEHDPSATILIAVDRRAYANLAARKLLGTDCEDNYRDLLSEMERIDSDGNSLSPAEFINQCFTKQELRSRTLKGSWKGQGNGAPIDLVMASVEWKSQPFVLVRIDSKGPTSRESFLRQQLEDSDEDSKRKSMLIASLSHEVRTPLNGILGYAEMLSGKSLLQDQTELLEKIRTPGEDLAKITSEIFDYLSLDAGSSSPNKHSFSLGDFLDSVLARCLDRESFECSVELASKKDVFIKTDRDLLFGIVTNILGFVLGNTRVGDLCVEANTNDIEKGYDLNFVLSFSNVENITFVSHYLEPALGRLGLVDSSSLKDNALGLALGLSALKTLKGSIRSELIGDQLKLLISVPVSKGLRTVKTIVPSEKKYEIPEGLRFLVVDDNPVNIEIASFHLRKLGGYTASANNGLEALKMCELQDYDFCLMDCQMPILDGYEATKRIIDSKGQARPYVIAMTANALQGDRQKCSESGMDDYLAKPLKKKVLYDSIVRGLNSSFKHTSASSKGEENFLLDTYLVRLMEREPYTLEQMDKRLSLFENEVFGLLDQLLSSSGLGLSMDPETTEPLRKVCSKYGLIEISEYIQNAEAELAEKKRGWHEDEIYFLRIQIEESVFKLRTGISKQKRLPLAG